MKKTFYWSIMQISIFYDFAKNALVLEVKYTLRDFREFKCVNIIRSTKKRGRLRNLRKMLMQSYWRVILFRLIACLNRLSENRAIIVIFLFNCYSDPSSCATRLQFVDGIQSMLSSHSRKEKNICKKTKIYSV